MTRRSFISGSALLASAWVTRRAAAAVEAAAADLKLGVLSDIHLKEEKDVALFRHALEHFRDRGADGVIIAGDMADTGLVSQLKWVAEAWQAVFPGSRAPDGRTVEKLFVYGNHDLDGYVWSVPKDKHDDPEAMKVAIGKTQESRARAWETVFGEKYEPCWMKTVKGYPVIGAHLDHLNDLPAFIAAHGTELGTEKPFFVIQHCHPQNTCFGWWAWGHDGGRTNFALEKFPNAVVFSGHSHYTLTDERSVWQGQDRFRFTSVNTGSLKSTSLDYSLRENVSHNGFGYHSEGRAHVMPKLDASDGHQGMFLSVYGNRLVLERRDFGRNLPLGPDWEFTAPGPGTGRSFAERKARRCAPAFAKDAVAKAEVAAETVTVTFPPAEPVDGCRVFEYEVTATMAGDDVELVRAQRRVLAPDFHLPPAAERRPGSCVFKLSELQCRECPYAFSIRPLDCYGVKGEAIVAKAYVK